MVAGEGVRSSTPGKGSRQWTSAGTSIHESAMFNTGARWAHGGDDHRIAVPRQPDILSDVAHRNLERVDVMRNHSTFATSADAEYAAEQRRLQLVAERRAAAEHRVLQMVTNKHGYAEEVRQEQQAYRAQEAQEAAARESAATARAAAANARQRAAEAAADGALSAAAEAKRLQHQDVASQQLAQMQQRKAEKEAEREADRRAYGGGGGGVDFFARFGTSLR